MGVSAWEGGHLFEQRGSRKSVAEEEWSRQKEQRVQSPGMEMPLISMRKNRPVAVWLEWSGQE